VPAEVAAAVAEQMPGATDAARQAEVEARCKALAQRGCLLEQWNLDDIQADLDWCGLRNSPTNVHRIQSVVLAGGDYRQFEPTDAGVNELVSELIEDHTIG
jgi:electron transfer flavoprotein beta subunit